MKGKNWREYAPEKERRKSSARQTANTARTARTVRTAKTPNRRRRKRKGGFIKALGKYIALFLAGYLGFMGYFMLTRPYTIALDAGHGGVDCGAEGVIQEVTLTGGRS